MAVLGRNRNHVTVPDSEKYQIKDGELFRLYDPDDSLKEEYQDVFTFLELNDGSNKRCTKCAFNDLCYLDKKYHIPACLRNKTDSIRISHGIFCTPEYYDNSKKREAEQISQGKRFVELSKQIQ